MQLALPLVVEHEAPDTDPARGIQPPAPGIQHPARGTLHSAPDPLPPPFVFVRHPKARRYVIRVRPDGSVRVTIPRGGSKRAAQDFAGQQHKWIERERERVRQDRVAAPDGQATDLERALRRRAAQELPSRLLELASAHGLRVSRISVRNQQWRWGSCSRNGHICLNWRLVDMPDPVRDYVMIHELMHLKRMDHSLTFWKLVAAACPDYQASRDYLREYRRR